MISPSSSATTRPCGLTRCIALTRTRRTCSASSRCCACPTSSCGAGPRRRSARASGSTASAAPRASTSCSACSPGTTASISTRPGGRSRPLGASSVSGPAGKDSPGAGVRPAMRRSVPLIVVALLASLGLGAPAGAGAADGRTLHVPAEYPGLAEAITASQPGDVILLAAGTYAGDIVVPENKPGITIRGTDRNAVVFDGAYTRANAIEVEADGVTLENMSAHGYVENGFYWDGVEGYAGRYLTVWNVGLYGIYAIESRRGVMEHSYVSGAADAAFYVGECHPCDAVLRNLTSTLSAVGYSGTNAGGNLVIETSLFENNATGILPNSYEVGLEPPPQREAIFRGNKVIGSGSVPTPRRTPLGGFHGIGI